MILHMEYKVVNDILYLFCFIYGNTNNYLFNHRKKD